MRKAFAIQQGHIHQHQRILVKEIGIDKAFSKNLLCGARLADSYRFATADEMIFSTQNLAVQKGHSYESYCHWRTTRTQQHLMLYQLNLNNEIMFVPGLQSTIWGSNENLPPTRRYGLLWQLRYLLTQRWILQLNYQYLETQFHRGPLAGKQIPFIAKQSLGLLNEYHWNSHWLSYLDLRYIGQRYPMNDVYNLAPKLGGFSLLTLGLGYHLKKLNVDIKINNLFNKRYNSYTISQYQNTQFKQNQVYPAPGRTCQLNLRWQW